MAFKVPTQAYTGTIRPITLEKDDTLVTVGGETAYPFYTFEGEMPHLPKIAIQVPDFTPDDWAEACLEPYRDVLGNPVAWAKKAQDVYKADMIVLWLKSTDPNGLNRSAEEAAETAKQVLEAIDVPLIVWGTANVEKDTEVLRQVAMACDQRICLGPVEEANHKQIGAQALAYNHLVIGSSPIDINLAKQLNILLGNLGVSDDNIIIDPTTGALGYGIEYCYSVMERIRQAALTQQDDRLQLPMISNLAEEVWKTKEAKLPDDPVMGNAENRGVLLEAMTATTLLMAGSDILVMRHPKAIQLIRNYIADMAGVERPEAIEVVTEEAAPEPAKAPAPSAAPAAVGNLPPGMRLEIDVASIMDAPITVGSEYILALVKITQEDEGGITIAQNAVEAFSAFASGQVAAPKTPDAVAGPPELAPQAEEEPEKEEEPKVEYLKTWDVPDDTIGDYDYPVEKVENFTGEKVDLLGQSAEEGIPEGKEDWRLKCEERDGMITYLKTAQGAVEVTPSPAPAKKAAAPAKPAEAEKKPEKEEEPKVEYLKTWDVPDDTVGDYDYPVDKVENFTGEKVDLLGQSAEEGLPEGKEDWRLKLQDKDQMVQYLKTGLRYWYSTEVFGSEKRKTPA